MYSWFKTGTYIVHVHVWHSLVDLHEDTNNEDFKLTELQKMLQALVCARKEANKICEQKPYLTD